jgi:hypothetical protein
MSTDPSYHKIARGAKVCAAPGSASDMILRVRTSAGEQFTPELQTPIRLGQLLGRGHVPFFGGSTNQLCSNLTLVLSHLQAGSDRKDRRLACLEFPGTWNGARAAPTSPRSEMVLNAKTKIIQEAVSTKPSLRSAQRVPRARIPAIGLLFSAEITDRVRRKLSAHSKNARCLTKRKASARIAPAEDRGPLSKIRTLEYRR